MESNMALTPEQVEQFRNDGYLRLEAITTQEEIQRLLGIYDKLFKEKAGRATGEQFDLAGSDKEGEEAKLPQILSPAKFAPELGETLYRANAEAIAKQLFGEKCHFHFDHAIYKPPQHGAETPWHQDEAYWNPELSYEGLSLWMPLQEVDESNGCMHFVPGSHRDEVIPHQPIGNDPTVHGLETVEKNFPDAVACPLPAGGATLHHCRTLHYAPANHSDRPRRAYILVFGAPPLERKTPREFPWLKLRKTAREERAKKSATTTETGY